MRKSVIASVAALFALGVCSADTLVLVARGQEADGTAFWYGAYNWEQRKGRLQISPRTNQTPNDYTWHELGVLEPQPGDRFWFGPGRFNKQGGAQSAVTGAYVDQLKFEALDK